MNEKQITTYKSWCRKEIIVAREHKYLSDEGLRRHLLEHAGYFSITRTTAEQVINNLMNAEL